MNDRRAGRSAPLPAPPTHDGHRTGHDEDTALKDSPDVLVGGQRPPDAPECSDFPYYVKRHMTVGHRPAESRSTGAYDHPKPPAATASPWEVHPPQPAPTPPYDLSGWGEASLDFFHEPQMDLTPDRNSVLCNRKL